MMVMMAVMPVMVTVVTMTMAATLLVAGSAVGHRYCP